MIDHDFMVAISKKPLEERDDRELEVSQIILQRETNRRLKNIENYVAFFFWITIISIGIVILAYVLGEM